MAQADQMRIGQHAQPGAAELAFITDDQIARELAIAKRQLAQVENGLLNLDAVVPSLARQVAAIAGILAGLAEQLGQIPGSEVKPG